MKQNIQTGAALVLGVTLVASCGGGGGGGSLAGGGIGGTGSGSITGFGSIFLNDQGKFETDTATILIDDVPALESDLNLGMSVDVQVNDTNAQFSSGTAQQVSIQHQVKGPITSLSPLRVLGQTVVVTGDTFIEDAAAHPANQVLLSALQLGDELEVSGPLDDQGVIQATRLEYKAAGLAGWQLVGRLNGLAGSAFTIGTQVVDFGAIVPNDCVGALKDGDRVRVKANPNPGFSAGDTLNAVTSLTCKPERLNAEGFTGVIEGEFEGFVTRVTSSTQFTLGDQDVVFDPVNVAFQGGTTQDIQVGVKLNAQGDLNVSSGTLTADRLRFREIRVRLEGPATLTAANQVSLLGLTVQVTAQTEDNDNLVGSALPGKQIRVKSYRDSAQTLFATEIEDRGAADSNDVRLRGPVANIDTAAQTFKILGVSVTPGVSYKIEDQPATAVAFFAAIKDGSEVSVESGTYSSLLNQISNAEIELEIDD